MGIVAAIGVVIGAGAAVAGTINAKKSQKQAAAEAERQRQEQEKLVAEAERETARTGEIADAQAYRTDVKNKRRKVRSAGGGGLLSGGDTGLMGTDNNKTKLGM